MIKTEKAVIDRIVDGEIAVLIVGEEELQLEYPSKDLPSDAREGSWLTVSMDGEFIVSIEIDFKETEEVAQRIRSKMSQLRARGRKPPIGKD